MRTDQRIWTRGGGWSTVPTNPLGDAAQAVMVFGDRLALTRERIEELKEWYPAARLIGCSTAGEIAGSEVLDESIVANAVSFESTHLAFAQTRLSDMKESFAAGQRLAQELLGEGLAHILILSDGLRVNGSELARGLTSVLPANVAVTGGLAGDGDKFEETLVLLDGILEQGSVAAMGLYGNNLMVGYGSRGGWTSFGQDRLVTRSEGNVLYELDGRPALDLYKEYLGDRARDLPAAALLFPLSLRSATGESYLVRTILTVDERMGSMTFAGDIPQDTYVRLMKAGIEGLVSGAEKAAIESRRSLEFAEPDLAILVSCVGRKLVMKERTEEEVEIVQSMLGSHTMITGFYSYGEICPREPTDKQCELHNQTMTITTFLEKRIGT